MCIRDRPFDLILMDVQMPVMDGLEATRCIRAQPAYAALPILAMTANAFAEDRQACVDAGTVSYTHLDVYKRQGQSQPDRTPEQSPENRQCRAQHLARPPPVFGAIADPYHSI